ncbi:MAG: hypothetical protein ABIK28_02670 [Planctomycetota bacterium]
MKSVFLTSLCVLLLSVSVSTFVCAQEPRWDGDGGYSGNYDNIPRLEWTGPGQPGTYAEYRKGRKIGPFASSSIYSSASHSGRVLAPKALVLVNSGLYDGIQANLDRYVSDLESDGYQVEVHAITGGTPESLKAFIISNATDLVGCVFVGDLPVSWYEMEYWGHEEFPCDFYYMDLDGDWVDKDSNGKWDEHSAGAGDEGPEIFIGHIDTSMMTGNEAALTNRYLDKNHQYRIGNLPVSDYGLSYTEDDWAVYMDIRTDIKHAYPNFDDIPAPATNKNDYIVNRVPSNTYEFIQLCCHSSDLLHAFTRGGYCYNYEIEAAVPFAMFYNLFCCSTLLFTSTDFLGGTYVYGSSATSVAVIGSTKSGSMLEFGAFYGPFGAYETFGESFRQWFNYLAPYDELEKAWHFGMTIAGDPFLFKNKTALILDLPEGVPEGKLPPGPETRITLKITSGSEQLVPGSGLLHYRFDANDPFTTAALFSLGSDLYEALLPNTHPGDEPEFYFSAQGDGGTTVCSPLDAPDHVYSFEVCFSEIVWEDDFETDQGWTVQNTDVIAGAFEWADPEGTDAQPEDDHSPEGTLCYVTGALNGGSVGANDLDGGPTRLISPMIDLSKGDALLEASVYFHHTDYGQQQPLQIHLSDDNGATWTLADEVTHYVGWQELCWKVSDHVTPTAQVRFRFTATDNPNDDIVEVLIDDFRVERLTYDPSLWADGYSISAGARTVIDLSCDAGSANGQRTYLLLGSMSGTAPGFTLPGGKVMPLNWDLFTDLVLGFLNTVVCPNFYGILDSAGAASATLDTWGPIDPVVVGERAHFAFVLNNPFDFTSNAIAVDFIP